ncbi:MAG: nucleotidyltransferase family protein [Ignavibacteria bacterium]|nr:nucleotidyltransferase family protein [Ignavibacteria bacterium]
MNRDKRCTEAAERASRGGVRERYGARRSGTIRIGGGTSLRDDSDIDVLVEFEGPATLDGYFDLQDPGLEELFGRPVDLVIEKGLKPRARRHVEQDLDPCCVVGCRISMT